MPGRTHPLIRKLDSIFELSDSERKAVTELPLIEREFKVGQDIIRERDRPSQCCVLLDGLLCRYRILPSGRRQTFSYHIPGDIPDLQSLHIDVMDHNLAPLVASKVGFIPHHILRAFLRDHPRISDVFWRDTLIEAAISREWIANVGGRDAYARMAHLFCEMYVRLHATGAIPDGTTEFPFPITQTELGHAVGISTVHVNRTLKTLRTANLITDHRSIVRIIDWPGLQKAGEFDATYLHVRSRLPSETNGLSKGAAEMD